MLRGIEIYKGRPIFYNLGSLLMEFESGEQKISPEMYESYGFKKDALQSYLHMSRVRDRAGNLIGFYDDTRFSKSCSPSAISSPETSGSSSCRSISISISIVRGRSNAACRTCLRRNAAVRSRRTWRA